MDRIEGISSASIRGIREVGQAQPAEKTGNSFSDFLESSIKQVNDRTLEADSQLQKTALGEEPNYHKTLIAMQKADISFRMMLSIKQRLEQAYRQVIQTQV